ncbi:MAG: aminotransferase class V-fold PLP-dependent enzyme, partial [Sphingobacteriia bacterium]|nr:aminotransferase class V-fold PLP-dependent enzyme [Sphingobacteriia bacterium]
SEGTHPSILEALKETNTSQEEGYGEDTFCLEATDYIRKTFDKPNAAVFFISGGTQANFCVIASLLKPFESVIAVDSGHICMHETGAIEACGHRINSIHSADGKITAQQIQSIFDDHQNDPPHMVQPKLVYISNSTEIGTIYTKNKLAEIYETCQKNNLFLYIDGARLGSALCSNNNDIKPNEILNYCDVLYIGGTKNGGLIGEAIVFKNPELAKEFPFHLKQRGALLGKERVFGVQFSVFFKSNLYFELAKHANNMAEKLSLGIKNAGCHFLTESPSNQIFPILPNNIIDELLKKYDFYIWAKIDEQNAAIRLVTSWATPEDKVDEFISDLTKLTE